ncbi:hypothetical protein [Serratia nevei]|uniref:hypothetical protein n=1 Tax=Serratia nevei TaxID=2703794 RepID=UPI0011F09EA2|nr:hypothetical protein [Serratia nevei]
MNKTNNPTELRQRLETTLDFISRSALGHDTGHCVHFANKAEAELHSVIDELDAALAAIEARRMEKFAEHMLTLANDPTYSTASHRNDLRDAGAKAMNYAAELREAK